MLNDGASFRTIHLCNSVQHFAGMVERVPIRGPANKVVNLEIFHRQKLQSMPRKVVLGPK